MTASIIITTYKRSNFLVRAIESCLMQDFQGEKEIIIVDDNGDGTPCQIETHDIIRDYICKNQIKYIVNKVNKGACAARNTGAEKAKGEYLLFLDDDDEFLPDKLSKQISFLRENKEYDAHACAFLKKRDGKDFPSTDGFPIIGDLRNYLMYGNVYTPMFCIKKDVFLEIGGFEEIPKFQDMYFICIFLEKGKMIYSGKEYLFIQHDHRQERISNKSITNAQIAVSKFKQLANKHKDLFSGTEWKIVQTRLTTLLATTYYSSSYINRLKSIRYWLRCFNLSKDKKYFYLIVKALIPNNLIKQLEGIKSKV